jgi:hypothetical protein
VGVPTYLEFPLLVLYTCRLKSGGGSGSWSGNSLGSQSLIIKSSETDKVPSAKT